jgi:hypothetical protein
VEGMVMDDNGWLDDVTAGEAKDGYWFCGGSYYKIYSS